MPFCNNAIEKKFKSIRKQCIFIENGLSVPWINTIFIHKPNLFFSPDNETYGLGLSDSYQIDGYPSLEGGIYDVEAAVETFVYPVFLFCGTVLTLPLVVLLYRCSYAVWSSCFFLAVTLILDMVLLCVYCGNDWYIRIYKRNLSNDIISISNASCKVYSFLSSFVQYLSPWVMVVITVDVFISMNHPNRIYWMCTRERAKATLLLIVVLLTFINLHFFWTVGLTEQNIDFFQVNRLCHLTYQDMTMEVFTQKVQPYIDFLFKHLIPFLVTSVFLCLILSSTCRNRLQKFDIQHLKNYFLEVEALFEMRLLALILSIWFAIIYMFQSLYEVLRLMFQGSETIDYIAMKKVDVTLKLLFYSFLSCKCLLFYILSAKTRRYMMGGAITVNRALTKRSQEYKLAQQSQNLIQESNDNEDSGVKLSTEV